YNIREDKDLNIHLIKKIPWTLPKISRNAAANGGDVVNNWLDRSENKALVNGSFDAYYGAGGKVGFDLAGEKAFLGVHLLTFKRSLTIRAEELRSTISGVEGGLGPVGVSFLYDWTEGGMDGFDVGVSFFGFNYGNKKDFSVGAGGYAYLFGGVGGDVNINVGRLVNELNDSLNSPFVDKSMFPMAMSGMYALPSDKNLKEHIEIIDSALFVLKELNGYKFTWCKDAPMDLKGCDIGLIAQEVESVFPELVQNDSIRGYKAVYYYKLIPILIEAIKEQQKTIESQELFIIDYQRRIDQNEVLIKKILLKLNIE
ncbi:MAG: tail fiber domain-containing protein, partial [Bacteroidales bacterium]|nr:tail fiber domain-containing protein [Bacteroidales bacterium]